MLQFICSEQNYSFVLHLRFFCAIFCPGYLISFPIWRTSNVRENKMQDKYKKERKS